MVKDKNGTELRIGDTVHYCRPEKTHEHDFGNGNIRTIKIQAKDVKFTITKFVDSPFVRQTGAWNSRMLENLLWITGPELDLTGKNSVSPLAVVRVDTIVKKKISSFSFVDEQPPVEDLIKEVMTCDKKGKVTSFITNFKKFIKL